MSQNKNCPKSKIRFGYLSAKFIIKLKNMKFWLIFPLLINVKNLAFQKDPTLRFWVKAYLKSKYILVMESIDGSLETFFSGISRLRPLWSVMGFSKTWSTLGQEPVSIFYYIRTLSSFKYPNLNSETIFVYPKSSCKIFLHL